MQQQQAVVREHAPAGAGYRVLVLACAPLAGAVRPGQFVHLRVPGLEASALRRPFSIYDAAGDTLAVLYKAVGRGTRALACVQPGQEVDVLGPLGNGFPAPRPGACTVLVAGGYGVAPLYFLATRLVEPGLLFAGGRTAEDLLCADRFAALGWDVRTATEDGSAGARGLVTAPLDAWLAARPQAERERIEVFACGPDGLLRAVGERAVAGGWRAWLSLDKHMGCGVGACLACVQRIRTPAGGVEWKRVCRDGPVFEAREVVWE